MKSESYISQSFEKKTFSSPTARKNPRHKRNLREKRRPTGVDKINDPELVKLQKIWRQSAGESTSTGSEDEELMSQLQTLRLDLGHSLGKTLGVEDDDEEDDDLTPEYTVMENTRFNQMIDFCSTSMESFESTKASSSMSRSFASSSKSYSSLSSSFASTSSASSTTVCDNNKVSHDKITGCREKEADGGRTEVPNLHDKLNELQIM